MNPRSHFVLLSLLVLTPLSLSLPKDEKSEESLTAYFKEASNEEEDSKDSRFISFDNEASEADASFETAGEMFPLGDIMLSPEQQKMWLERHIMMKNLWPAGRDGNIVVPYTFGDSEVAEKAVLNGLQYCQQHTCIQFERTTNLGVPHLNFVNKTGCWSQLGMQKTPGQDISIGEGCGDLSTVVHEVGHAMGINHEHMRADRDDYVHINKQNIQEMGISEFLLNKDGGNYYGVPYDYSSIMHYQERDFSEDDKLTIATLNPFDIELMVGAPGFTHFDKLLANRMYSCIGKWLGACGLGEDPCLNYGYTGRNCKCVCPPGTSGKYCQTVTGDYYASLRSKCHQAVTAKGTLTSPNYPNNYPAGVKCVKMIKAPSKSQKVQLTFNSFELTDQGQVCGENYEKWCCDSDSLEIRTADLYNGKHFCGTMIQPGTVFTSESDTMILYFRTTWDDFQGWSANVTFV